MQAVRAGVRARRSSASASLAPMIKGPGFFPNQQHRLIPLRLPWKSRKSLPRVLDLLRYTPFIDPTRVSATASFKDELQLDTLDNNQVMIAAKEELAIDIVEK